MPLSHFRQHTRFYWQNIQALPNFRQNSVELVLASVTINILALALPIVLMQVYDRIVPTQATNTLLWLVVGFFFALVAESLLRLLRFSITNWLAAQFEFSLSHACVDRWLHSRLNDFEKDGAGVHLDRIRAINTLRNFYSGQATQLLLDLPFAFLFLALIGVLGGWQLVVYLLVVTTVFLCIIGSVRKRYHACKLSQKNQNDKRYNFLVEALSGIHTLKALTFEESMLRRHERLEGGVAQSDYDVIFVGSLPLNIAGLFSQCVLFGVLLVGGSAVIAGNVTLGSLAACTLLSGRFFQPFKSLASFWVRYADIEIARNQIRDIAELEEESAADAPHLPVAIDGSITLENVSFRYTEDGPLLLDNVDMHIAPRKFVCLATQNLRGTKTLLYLMYGLNEPTQGKVLIDETDLSTVDHNDYKGRIEFLPQQGTLFNGTIFENLTLFNPAHRDAAVDTAALLQLEDVLADLPLGFETQVGNRLYEFLPSGVVQRICLARALTIRPRILLLDKVDESMDAESEELLFWLLEKLKGNCTIVMATANPKILAMADSIYVLQDGELGSVNPQYFQYVF